MPQDRNWALGEKCEACQRGGQPCGPNERFERHNGRTTAGDEAFNQPLIHQASPPSNVASPELYPANIRSYGFHPQPVATPASQQLDDGYGIHTDEVSCVDEHNDLLVQLFNDIDEPGSSRAGSGAEILPKR